MAPSQDDALTLAQQGIALAESGRYHEAVQRLSAAAQSIPDNVEVRMWLGHCYEQMGFHQQALEQYLAGVELAPNDNELKGAAARMQALLRQTPSVASKGVPVGPDGRRVHGRLSPLLVGGLIALLLIPGCFFLVRVLLPAVHPPSSSVSGRPPGRPRPGTRIPVPTTAGPSVDIEGTKVQAKEARLKAALRVLRSQLEQYRADSGRYPDNLLDLPGAGLDLTPPSKLPPGAVEPEMTLTLPVDPFTGRADTWAYDPLTGEVHSGSDATALDGTPYSDW